MKKNKGFTLIEIIICIVLVGLIGGTSVVVVNKKNNNDINKIEKRILEAAQVYVEVEKDSNGKDYLKEISNGRKGLKIPFKTLVNEGYIKEDEADKVYKEKKDKLDKKDFYVLLLAEGGDACSNSELQYTLSYTIDTSNPVYLCESVTPPEGEEGDQEVSFIDELKNAYGGDEMIPDKNTFTSDDFYKKSYFYWGYDGVPSHYFGWVEPKESGLFKIIKPYSSKERKIEFLYNFYDEFIDAQGQSYDVEGRWGWNVYQEQEDGSYVKSGSYEFPSSGSWDYEADFYYYYNGMINNNYIHLAKDGKVLKGRILSFGIKKNGSIYFPDVILCESHNSCELPADFKISETFKNNEEKLTTFAFEKVSNPNFDNFEQTVSEIGINDLYYTKEETEKIVLNIMFEKNEGVNSSILDTDGFGFYIFNDKGYLYIDRLVYQDTRPTYDAFDFLGFDQYIGGVDIIYYRNYLTVESALVYGSTTYYRITDCSFNGFPPNCTTTANESYMDYIDITDQSKYTWSGTGTKNNPYVITINS